MAKDAIEHGVQNLEQALGLIRKARAVFVHVKLDGFIVGNSDEYVPRCFNSAVELSKKEAVKMVTDMFKYNRHQRVMRMSEHPNDGFVSIKNGVIIPAKPYYNLFIG